MHFDDAASQRASCDAGHNRPRRFRAGQTCCAGRSCAAMDSRRRNCISSGTPRVASMCVYSCRQGFGSRVAMRRSASVAWRELRSRWLLPHHGTPLANHFLTIQGQTLLLVLSGMATSGKGRGAILAAAKAMAVVAKLDDWLGRSERPLDRIAAALLRRIRLDRNDPVWKYLGEIERDRARCAAHAGRHGAVRRGGHRSGRRGPPLRRRGSAAAAREDHSRQPARPRIHCAAVAVPIAARPDVAAAFALPVSKAECHDAAAHGPCPWIQGHRRRQRRHRADIESAARPTAACRPGGPFDVVGHYTLAGGRTADWLPSGAGFTTEGFEATWDAVAAAIAKNCGPAGRA